MPSGLCLCLQRQRVRAWGQWPHTDFKGGTWWSFIPMVRQWEQSHYPTLQAEKQTTAPEVMGKPQSWEGEGIYPPVPSGCFPTSNHFPMAVTDRTSGIRKLNGGEDSQPRNTKQKMPLRRCKNYRGWDYSYSAWVKIWSLLAFFSREPDLIFVQGVSFPAEVGGM